MQVDQLFWQNLLLHAIADVADGLSRLDELQVSIRPEPADERLQRVIVCGKGRGPVRGSSEATAAAGLNTAGLPSTLLRRAVRARGGHFEASRASAREAVVTIQVPVIEDLQ